MRVLVFEQSHGGHYYQYVHYLLAGLVTLPVEVVVGITNQGRRSDDFKTLLSSFEDRVEFDASVPEASTGLLDRWTLYKNLTESVKRHRPAYLYVPSADWQSNFMGIVGLLGRSPLPKNTHGEAAFHYGALSPRSTKKESLKEFTRTLLQSHSYWNRVFFVNFQQYDRIAHSDSSFACRVALLPDPVPKFCGPEKLEARRILGIPEDGRYIGVIGVLDQRKGIPELLAAWHGAQKNRNDRMLFAGKLTPHLRHLLNSEGEELIRRSQLFVIDRFLDEYEFSAALAAVDVVWAVYPHLEQVSSMVLKATAAERPVIALNSGWCGEIVHRFQLGWLCNSPQTEVLRTTIFHAITEAAEYTITEAAQRLLTFHRPENFSETWMETLRAQICKPIDRTLPSWAWVNNLSSPYA